MPRGLPKRVKNFLEKACESALQAVAVYNNPLTSFRSGSFIVLMIIAWTSLLLAIFHKRKMKPYYRKEGSNHFVRVDGEPKPWDLAECIRQYWSGSDNAVSQNLRFFLDLRHRIEHRLMPELDIEIFGECQAMLFNFEDLLEKEFGSKYALNKSLAISLQFSRIRIANQQQAIRQLMKPFAANIREYIDKFRSSLSDDILGDMAYSYKLFLLPNVGNHRSKDALAVEFIHYDPNDPQQQEMLEKVSVFIKEKHVTVVHPGKLKPSRVVEKVASQIAPKVFRMHEHTKCWTHYGVRPPGNSLSPTDCDTRYCQYDDAHKDYIYNLEWVRLLIKKLKDDDEYKRVMKGEKLSIPLS